MSSEKLPDSLKSESPFLPPTQEVPLHLIPLTELVDQMNYVSRHARKILPTHGNGDLYRERIATGMNAVACGKDPRT
jgi:hypothetical protein